MLTDVDADVERVRECLSVLETFHNDAERKRLDAGDCFITILPIAQHAGQSRNVSDPATVFLALELDREGHPRNVPSAAGHSSLPAAVS